MSYPHLYSCSVCEKAVKVTIAKDGVKIDRKCGHDGATVFANRKVTLYGKGDVNVFVRSSRKIKLSVRQFLSWATKRSI